MRKILVLIILLSGFAGCADKLDVTYGDYDITITGLDTPLSALGETRRITVSAEKQKYINGRSMDLWFVVPASEIRITLLQNEPFVITNEIVSRDVLSFDLVVPENTLEMDIVCSFNIDIENGALYMEDWVYVEQQAAEITREYRFRSDANPFVVPVEGGEFTVGFTVEWRFTVNGKQDEWAPTDLVWLSYSYVCNASEKHKVKLKKGEGYGRYYFDITAEPFFFTDESAEIDWRYSIVWSSLSSLPPLFTQVFQHPQDRELAKDPEETHASKSGWSGGPLEI